MILAHRTVLTDHDLNIPGDVLSLIAYANKPAFRRLEKIRTRLLLRSLLLLPLLLRQPRRILPLVLPARARRSRVSPFRYVLDKTFAYLSRSRYRLSCV